MARFRRLLGPLAGSWLLCQIATLTVAPVALAWHTTTELECTCPQGAEGVCPMHHQKTSVGAKQCVLRNAADGTGSALVSLLNPLGLLPSATRLIAPALADSASISVFSTVRDLLLPPDAPPPRL